MTRGTERYKLKELLSLNQIYEIKNIDSNDINLETKVSISTVQGLLKRTILSDKPDLMPGAFDLIIFPSSLKSAKATVI